MVDSTPSPLKIETVPNFSDIPQKSWDALLAKSSRPNHPFLQYDFLEALESSGSVSPETGWSPLHALLYDGQEIVAAAPLYLKTHSMGEFVFDHAFADAYERGGGRYYPKLLSAIPFTPVTGPRLLALSENYEEKLAYGLQNICAKFGFSSLHINFAEEHALNNLSANGYLKRQDQQFHFQNKNYSDFEGFLATLTSRKRKALRKERQSIIDAGIEIEWLRGCDITETHLDQFWLFYQDTGARKWGTPYLSRQFFSSLIEKMSDQVLLIFAHQDGQTIAGTLNMIGQSTLYGRYWGCSKYVPNLHFELCYYQAIDFAIQEKLATVEAGAQGEHKLARGYEPVPTYSAHYFPAENFHEAVAAYLKRETEMISEDMKVLKEYTPFKKNTE